jgi:putative hemolysin
MMIDPNYVIIVVVALLLSAFFSGVEIAFISADKLHIELRSQQGHYSDKILSKFLKRPSWFITTTLIGNNVTLVIYGIFMAIILEPIIIHLAPGLLENQLFVFVAQTVIATLIVLVTAEFLPKSLFLIDPNKMISILAIPINVIYFIFLPFVWLIVTLSKFTIEKTAEIGIF